MKRIIVLLALLPGALAAEVATSSDSGFSVVRTIRVKTAPAATYRALGQPGRWWNKDHTWSGDAGNLSLISKAGGCFCERLAGSGTVEHGRVIYAHPGKMLRFSGALGPLQSEAATGTMTWELKAINGGTEITQTYVAGGFVRMGFRSLAPAVDAVLGDQLDRLANYLGKAQQGY